MKCDNYKPKRAPIPTIRLGIDGRWILAAPEGWLIQKTIVSWDVDSKRGNTSFRVVRR